MVTVVIRKYAYEDMKSLEPQVFCSCVAGQNLPPQKQLEIVGCSGWDLNPKTFN